MATTVPFPPAPKGDAYSWRATFPDASYLEAAPDNVLAQIRDSRDTLVGSWSVTVDGAALVFMSALSDTDRDALESYLNAKWVAA